MACDENRIQSAQGRARAARVQREATGVSNLPRRPQQPEAARFRHRPRALVTSAVLTALYGAQAFAEPTADTSASTGSSGADALALQEVTVTATRRAATAQDLPMSITAISGITLEQSGIQDVGALARSLAGVDFTDKGPFSGVTGANLIIRGLNADTTGWLAGAATPVVPPVATYVDDTPLFVNLRLQDLDRVEILRGPQGTLYGSGSLGGTIRYVQNAPDPSGFDAKMEAGVSDTAHTGAPNETVSGMLNVPISDTFALRANAGWTYDAGYINQPNLFVLDSTGVPVAAQPGNLFSPPEIYENKYTNDYHYTSARIAALWKPNDSFHAQLSYYYQRGSAGGFPYIATSAAAYTQPISAANQPTGTFTNPPLALQLFPATVPAGADRLSNADNAPTTTVDDVSLVALTLDYDIGFATFTSASGWAHHRNQTITDETTEYQNFFFFQDTYGQNPRNLFVGYELFDDKPWSQEFRLVSKTGGMLDWVGGLFFKHEETTIVEDDFTPGDYAFYTACAPIYGPSIYNGVNPSYCGIGEPLYSPGPTTYTDGYPNIKDQSYISAFETTYTDLAAFGELTAHVTSAWSVTGGARLFRQTVSQGQQNLGFFAESITNLSLSHQWKKALWKLNTSYQLDPTNLVYVTFSQGFRRGGVNALPATENVSNPPYMTPAALEKVAPDTADNYEIGVKGTIENRLRYSTAIYDVQWHNIQEGTDLTPYALPGALNVGNGYSRGLELDLEAVLTAHLTGHVAYTYDQTKLTSLSALFALPNSSFAPPAIGSALPGTPKSSIAAGLDFGPIAFADGKWRYGINAHYQSAVLPALSATVPTVAGFTMLDTRLSYARSHWTATLYANNLTNNLGITTRQDPALLGNRAQEVVSQPRTLGITLGYSFR